MSVINMAKNIKQVHPESVICYKIGTFYHCYGKDAYIISYLFGYKLNLGKEKIMECGFPIQAISKVMARLEQQKVDYLILEPRNNYYEDNKSENGNLNEYNELFNKAYSYMRIVNRIDRISEALKLEITSENIKDKLRRIEEIINEE